MEVLRGQNACSGTAIGSLWVYVPKRTIKNRVVQSMDTELNRFKKAQTVVQEKLTKLYQSALKQVGEDKASIFDVHKMLLNDPELTENIVASIKKGRVAAEEAVSQVGAKIAQTFANMDDDYMRARAADVKDVVGQLLATLQEDEPIVMPDHKVIVAAEDLTPSLTLQLDKSKVLGFITTKGSSNSHTAILARTMGIPAIVAVDHTFTLEDSGKNVAMDGAKGIIYLEPEPEILAKLQHQCDDEADENAELAKLIGEPTVTTDGRKIELAANIGQMEDLPLVIANDAEAIGLFRSEFLYLGRDSAPSEDEQFEAYKAAAVAMKGKRVIIRTVDIGADKTEAYFGLEQEENPAMGLRAIRLCLQRPDIFKTQLKAILRASAYGKVAIMFPMIIDQGEVRAAKNFLTEAKADLEKAGIPFDKKIEIGIMIETPAAAVLADILAQEVDFFSIGTNDLVQYVLAADRQNSALNYMARVNHPAVLRLIKNIIVSGHQAGIWVGMCGEAAGDLALTETLLSMGIDELSVAPSKILPVRAIVRSI